MSSNTVVDTIPVGMDPNGIAFDPVTNEMWVANEGSGTVDVIDTTNNTIPYIVSTGTDSYPWGVGIDTSDGFVYVSDWLVGGVSVIDDRTFEPTGIGVVSVGGSSAQPMFVAVNSSTGNVYVADYESNTVDVIDGTTVTASIPSGGGPEGVAVDPSNNWLFVSDYHSGNIEKFSTTTNALLATENVGSVIGPSGLAIDPGTGTLWIADGDGYATETPESLSAYTDNATGGVDVFQPAVNTSTHNVYMSDISGSKVYEVADGTAPAFTSPDSTTFTLGTYGSFTVTATGEPVPTITQTGTLPTGLTFSNGVISGTPTQPGTFYAYLYAYNGVYTSETLTLSVVTPPQITSGSSATFAENTYGQFNVTATGSPAPTITVTGPLPSGVGLFDYEGIEEIVGTAQVTGVFPLTVTASNGVSPDATQSFTLTVVAPPSITSANATTFTLNTPGTFTLAASGYPVPTFTESGALPSGVTLSGDSISGTPTQTGDFPITLDASNGVSPDATQSFTLTVNPCAGTATRCFTSPSI